MRSCTKNLLYIVLASIVCIIFAWIYYNFFFRYDFDSDDYFDEDFKEGFNYIKKFNPTFNIKTCKSLFFVQSILLSAPKDLITQFTLKDGKKISDEQYNKVLENLKTISNDKTSTGLRDNLIREYIECFIKFSTSESNNKLIFNLDEEEIKFINNNATVFKELRQFAYKVFTEECVKYLTENNVFITETDKISFMALFSARYAKFATLQIN